jgi:hypothetical protein
MKSQAKITNRVKIFPVFIFVLLLTGILLLQKLKSGKLPESQKSSLARDEISKVTNNTDSTGNKDSEGNSVGTSSKAPLEVLSSKNSQARLVNEDNISELELPRPFDDAELEMEIAKAKAIQVYKEQDKIMATWPDYLDVRDKLHKKLLAGINLDALSSDELVDIALDLRNKFWQAGGNLSTVSYKDVYKARILLEIAHKRNPENVSVIDELVETIQSAEVAWKYKENSKKKLANLTYQTILPELRSLQFSQIKKNVEEGHRLTWDDFVRSYELALLWGRADKSKPAQEVVAWLIPEAERAGYEVYIEQLKRLGQKLKENSVLEFNIYVSHNSNLFEEIKYRRRFPSFQGPAIGKRLVLPVHESLSNPTWYRDPARKR